MHGCGDPKIYFTSKVPDLKKYGDLVGKTEGDEIWASQRVVKIKIDVKVMNKTVSKHEQTCKDSNRHACSHKVAMFTNHLSYLSWI